MMSLELRSSRIGSSWRIWLYYVSFISEFNLKSREFGANWWIRVRICGWSFLCRVNQTVTSRTLNQLRFFRNFLRTKENHVNQRWLWDFLRIPNPHQNFYPGDLGFYPRGLKSFGGIRLRDSPETRFPMLPLEIIGRSSLVSGENGGIAKR